MLWYKNWLECRFRVWLCVWMAASVVAAAVLTAFAAGRHAPAAEGLAARWMKPAWQLATAPAEQFVWGAFLEMLAAVLVPVGALILAGSGINSQTNWGMRQGFHPAMEFVLSLPVTRARLYWTRVVMGWLGLMGIALAAMVVAVAGSQWTGVPLSVAVAARIVPYLVVGATLYYAFGVWLTTWLDEFWSGMIGLTLVGMISGYSVAGGPGWVAVVNFMQARPLLIGGQWAVLQGLFYVALAGVLLAAGQYVVRTREY